MQVQPYLFFEGRADEAIGFYKKTLGAKVEMVMRFKDAPDQSMISPGSHDKVMHASIKIGETTVLASDGRNSGNPNFQGFSLTVYAKDEAEADKLFGALGEGGQVRMPMDKTFFAKRFGVLADKFGVGWMVIAP
jgi:PhnB protein